MKIQQYLNDERYDRIRTLWIEAAEQASLESGVMIEVGVDYPPTTYGSHHSFTRIYFKFDGKEFEGLQDLRRVLNLKAFL